MKTLSRSQFLTLISLALMLALVSLSGCSPREEVVEASTISTQEAAPVVQTISGGLTANGIIQPVDRVQLSCEYAGTVESIEVIIGEEALAGQVLLQLDTTEAQLAVEMAEAELVAAQANYDLEESSYPAKQQAEVTLANLELLSALQALETLLEEAGSEVALAQVKFDIQTAQRTLDSLLEEQVRMSGQRCSQSVVDKLYADFLLVQDKYLLVKEDYENNYAWKAEDSLERAAALSNLSAVRDEWNRARANLEYCQGTPDEQDIAYLEAEIALAQAQLDESQQEWEEIQDGEPDPDALALAQARVEAAEARVALATDYSSASEQLALAEIRLDTAQLSLDAAQAQMERLSVTAPFDGVVAEILVSRGAWCAPGMPVIELLDLSGWRVETRNVGELEIGQVKIGQSAVVWVNAFKTEELAGSVVAISPDSIVQQGDVTYTLVIELAPTDLNLRPGMTARVEIDIED